ncbi:MAG: SH3 domain-containing protein [Solirubrobacterales bacterium]|nr:SH3 domain-containing protein [Solirubrobacterales bacterium]
MRVVGEGGPVTVRVLCRRPDARGSLVAADRAQVASPRAGGAGGAASRVCARRVTLRTGPGGPLIASAFAGQPVTVLERRGGWARVKTDLGHAGWLRAAALCAG